MEPPLREGDPKEPDDRLLLGAMDLGELWRVDGAAFAGALDPSDDFAAGLLPEDVVLRAREVETASRSGPWARRALDARLRLPRVPLVVRCASFIFT